MLSSIGIDLFQISIVGIVYDEDTGQWKLIILTEGADFLKLGSPQLLSQPNNGQNVETEDGNGDRRRLQEDQSGCISSGSICLQVWTLLTPPPDLPDFNITNISDIDNINLTDITMTARGNGSCIVDVKCFVI